VNCANAGGAGYSELMRLLIYSGLNPCQQDHYHQTPLHLSCIRGDLTAVHELCELVRHSVYPSVVESTEVRKAFFLCPCIIKIVNMVSLSGMACHVTCSQQMSVVYCVHERNDNTDIIFGLLNLLYVHYPAEC